MVIDGSNLAYRAYFKFRNIQTTSYGHLGLVYGFIKILQSYLIRFKPTKLVVIFDTKESKRSNFRNTLLDGYKIQRSIKTNLDFDYKQFNKQLKSLRGILTSLGVSVIWDNKGLGHETDDYIAYIVTKGKKDKNLIISSDKDFYQLVTKKTKIFNPSQDKLITLYNGEEVYGYTPKLHKEFLILNGDASDSVPGYKGMGPVRCKAFFKQFGSIEGYLNSPDEYPYVTKEGVDFLYKRNKPLVDLEYALKKYPVKEVPLINREYNYKRAFKQLDRYSMSSFLNPDFAKLFKNLEQWKI